MATSPPAFPPDWLSDSIRAGLLGSRDAVVAGACRAWRALRSRVLLPSGMAIVATLRAVARVLGWWVARIASASLRALSTSVQATGRTLDLVSRGVPVAAGACVTGVSIYVDWWSRAVPAAGERLLAGTGWLLGRATVGVRVLTDRVMPAYAFVVTLATACAMWVVLAAAAMLPAATRYGGVVGADFAKPGEVVLPELAERSEVYAADGRLLAVLHDEENRRAVDLSELPAHVWQAVIAAEDRRFFEHQGYDLVAIARAAVANVQARAVVQGGSTITQQVARRNFLSDDVTLHRKAREFAYAVALEDRFTKRQLLERYLNEVYFGGGAYGVAAAAEEWFDVPPDELTLEQAALLAGLIRSPSRLDPRVDEAAATARRNAVLEGMADEGFISSDRAATATEVPTVVMPRREPDVSEPFVVEAVKREFVDNAAFGEDRSERIEYLFTGGLEIHTTLDRDLQRAARETAEDHFPPEDSERTTAIAAVDPRDGRILATYSGGDFEEEAYDLAIQGRRHPGSAFKTFVLATALEQGRSLDSTVDGSGPREFRWHSQLPPYRVRNFADASYGSITLRDALVRSVNTAFVELILDTGISDVVEHAEDFGIDVDAAFGAHRGPAIAIGGMTHGVTPLEMASATGTFAAGGEFVEPYFIERVTDGDAEEVYRHSVEPTRAVSADIAATMLDAMTAVVEEGTGTRAQLPDWDVAGKTGTAQDFADAWFIGTTPVLSTAVWVGHPDGRVPFPDMTGGQYAAPVWRDFMAAALDGRDPRPFPDS